MDEEVKEEQLQSFATAEVAAVAADGLRLILPGEEEAGEKVYPCNAGVKFSVGDRVVCMADSGTMIVLFPLGAPGSRVPEGVPSGGTNDQILRKTAGGAAWSNETTELPTTGTVGQVLKKTANGSQWADESGLPTGGTTGQVLKKLTGGAGWADETKELPATGTTGYVLKKTSTGVAWQAESGGLPSGGSNGNILIRSGSGSAWSGSLGSSTYDRFGNLYVGQINAGGNCVLGASNSYLGFFGSSGSTKKYLSGSATVSELITALKGYGLFS